MTREMTPSAMAATLSRSVRMVVLVEVDFPSGTVYLNSSDRNLTIDGTTYYGVAGIGTISSIEDTAQLQSSSLQFTLAYIPKDYLRVVLEEQYQGNQSRVLMAFLDDTYAVIRDPVVMFHGIVDQMSATVGESARITITAQNELARWETANIRRYTHADQIAEYPEDMGLQFVAQTTEKELYWGGAPVTEFTRSGGGAPSITVDFTYVGSPNVGEGGGAGSASQTGDVGGEESDGPTDTGFA